jgi:hypothetical protein
MSYKLSILKMITMQSKKTKGTKAILLIKIHQDISSKTMEEIPALKGQSVKRTMLKLSTIKGKQ